MTVLATGLFLFSHFVHDHLRSTAVGQDLEVDRCVLDIRLSKCGACFAADQEHIAEGDRAADLSADAIHVVITVGLQPELLAGGFNDGVLIGTAGVGGLGLALCGLAGLGLAGGFAHGVSWRGQADRDGLWAWRTTNRKTNNDPAWLLFLPSRLLKQRAAGPALSHGGDGTGDRRPGSQ